MDLFGHKARHATLTNAITTLSEAVAGLNQRLNFIDRRIEQVNASVAEASQENRNHADAVLTATADNTQHIHGLKVEHENVRAAVNHLRHAIENVPVPGAREVPVRN